MYGLGQFFVLTFKKKLIYKLGIWMEFLLIWVLGGDVIDSGLRYKSAAKCFSESQNAATEMRDVGLTSPQFTKKQKNK